ncbi:hypothetical protein BC629DRAFT_1000797 [Irpex lacteus]|nr:hypothetical protein BC629DRAFT_1000797 [Irpex lacteus]
MAPAQIPTCNIVAYLAEQVVNVDVGINFGAAYLALQICHEVEDFHHGGCHDVRVTMAGCLPFYILTVVCGVINVASHTSQAPARTPRGMHLHPRHSNPLADALNTHLSRLPRCEVYLLHSYELS